MSPPDPDPGAGGWAAPDEAGRVAPDGSPVAVYAALPAEPEYTPVLERLAGDESVLDLGCGPGRLANELAGRGHRVVGVDESPAMLERLSGGVRGVYDTIEGLALGRHFDVVVLASYLVNVPDRDRRAQRLAACARHVVADGRVLLARLAPRWARTVTTERAAVGEVDMRLQVTQRRPGLLELQTVFRRGGQSWTHDQRARILDDGQLADELAAVGLRLEEALDGWWVLARPATTG